MPNDVSDYQMMVIACNCRNSARIQRVHFVSYAFEEHTELALQW